MKYEVLSIDSDGDLIENLEANATHEETSNCERMFLEFIRFFTSLSKSLMNISLREVLQWIKFVDSRVLQGSDFADAYVHSPFIVFVDCVLNMYMS